MAYGFPTALIVSYSIVQIKRLYVLLQKHFMSGLCMHDAIICAVCDLFRASPDCTYHYWSIVLLLYPYKIQI